MKTCVNIAALTWKLLYKHHFNKGQKRHRKTQTEIIQGRHTELALIEKHKNQLKEALKKKEQVRALLPTIWKIVKDNKDVQRVMFGVANGSTMLFPGLQAECSVMERDRGRGRYDGSGHDLSA